MFEITNYAEALQYIFDKINYERKSDVVYSQRTFKLSRVNKLLALMGNPHKRLRAIHIAGTKGKGSTAYMISSILTELGYKTGLYTSPHLINIEERFQIDRTLISKERFYQLIRDIEPFVESFAGMPVEDRPTFFEILTAAAFKYFNDEMTDFCVIEVGLGGRLDATNVLMPLVCIITNISYDHTHLLGNTLRAIAREKAGIIKPAVPVILGKMPQEPLDEMLAIASERKAPIFRYDEEYFIQPSHEGLIDITLGTKTYKKIRSPLLGSHQEINCATALACCNLLEQNGLIKLDEDILADGLKKIPIHGRIELVHEKPFIILDGSHNPASIDALAKTVRGSFKYRKFVLVFGVSRDKDYPKMIEQIAPLADVIIVTRSDNPRAVHPEELYRLFAKLDKKVIQTHNATDASKTALKHANPEDLICITGSFYLAGEAQSLLLNKLL